MTDIPRKAFFRPGKIVLFLILGTLVYLAAAIVWMPAGWVWARVSPMVDLPPQIAVEQVSGTLWSGAARVRIERRPVRMTWALSSPNLAKLQLPLNITVESQRSRLQGDLLVAWPAWLELNARGQVHVPEFENEIRASGGALLSGDVIIDRLRVTATDRGIQSARGFGRWPGGNVSWPMGDQRQSARFPPMQGTLSDVRNGVSLVIAEEGTPDPAADATVTFDGMMGIRVYRRMIDLAGQEWSSASSPGDVVFQVRLPLMSAGGF